jgi:hypothetical protein
MRYRVRDGSAPGHLLVLPLSVGIRATTADRNVVPVDQVVPYADSGPLSARLVQNGTLKTYKGFPHGMPTTEAPTINADLLAFVQS